jgi:hypothetical protein
MRKDHRPRPSRTLTGGDESAMKEPGPRRTPARFFPLPLLPFLGYAWHLFGAGTLLYELQ